MHFDPPPLFTQGVPAKAKLIVFMLLSVILIMVDSRMRVLEPVRSHIRTFLSPLQTVVNLPFTTAHSMYAYFNETKVLLEENARLRHELEEMKLTLASTAELVAQNKQLRELMLIRHSLQPHRAILVEIRGEVGDRFSRNLLLDHGMNAGIRTGMPVVDSFGLLGQISRSYADQSEVLLITSKNVQVPVQVERSGLRTICEGVGDSNAMRLNFVPLDADIAQGDRVITSGIDGVFPRNTLVGYIGRIERVRGEHYAQVELLPAAHIQDTRFARVLIANPDETPAEASSPVEIRRGGRP